MPSAQSAGASTLAKTLHDPRYGRLIQKLVELRQAKSQTQRDLAAHLDRPPSYVAKIESLQRRVDLVELIDMLDALGVKPAVFVAELVADITKRRR